MPDQDEFAAIDEMEELLTGQPQMGSGGDPLITVVVDGASLEPVLFSQIQQGDDPATVPDDRVIELLEQWYERDLGNIDIARQVEGQWVAGPKAAFA